MGNEKSALNGLKIDEKPVEITDFWTHYMACVNGYNAQRISVFVSEPSLHYNANFGNPSPLEKAAKNLMLYRHPCILKYVSSWSKGSKFFLATEQVKPLIQSIETQNTLQICMGLYSILRALVFLHEKAFVSHNNLCESSIYVTPEGCWKLGGLECLCKFNDLTSSYLQKIKSYRCEKAISINEDTTITLTNFTTIDVYAFGVLAEDILRQKDPDDVPSLLEFKQFCKENLQNPDPSLRTLITQLRMFPENIVAEQLGRLLLSRMVLLDTTAQEQLLPFILKPKDGNDNTDSNLFSISTFKVYLVPKLLQMFCIRDVSIRLVLLSYFNSFVHIFQVDELKSQVLPELLVGIKDTNDHLVSATLKALADIVPILGAATVIGGNRGKLFTDGRPNKLKDNKKTKNSINAEFVIPTDSIQKVIDLPERPSPDGGEDKKEITSSITEEEYTWSDWDIQETADVHARISQSSDAIFQSQSNSNDISISDSTLRITTDAVLNIDKNKTSELKLTKKSAGIISDISELDIKNSKLIDTCKEEYDYFTDMEPVIKKTQILHIQQPQILSKSVFDIKALNGLETSEENNGWEEDLSDWGTEDVHEIKT
ncbi:protein-associating with the carboxyl-terminal domain of ezrin isoform X3 [Bombus vosnesenskii]|uniref:Protein-associating with the carboxyl-terminal domain of ezrin isoform X3 n=1 Tax=Bombus vosnesenskii TaxID=207650 RepID=A0A6J3KK92_9HYME|nr:protein-associating with the carboxyl-terminal domain of ezrin isoform X3 [Bombus vancouverensis nearcticus]XP_033353588.1 protein-associating with the carboxyl-terminal domain of ezrin isoform X3 [Bombus vosnesenskii]